jgi:hypothetical protein
MAALLTILAVLAMFVLVYWIVTWSRIRTTESVACPGDGKVHDVSFVHTTGDRWEPGEVIDVARCSAFEHPDQVTCNKACIPGRRKAAGAT